MMPLVPTSRWWRSTMTPHGHHCQAGSLERRLPACYGNKSGSDFSSHGEHLLSSPTVSRSPNHFESTASTSVGLGRCTAISSRSGFDGSDGRVGCSKPSPPPPVTQALGWYGTA